MNNKKIAEPPKDLSPKKLLEFFSNTGVKVCHRVYSAEVVRGLCFDMFGSYCTHDDGPYIDGGLPSGGLYESPSNISIVQEYDIIIEEEVLAIFWSMKDGKACYVIIPSGEDISDVKNIEADDPEYQKYMIEIE